MSYIPTHSTPSTWKGTIPTEKAGKPTRLGTVSSGSSKNYTRGHVGAEWKGGAISGAIESASQTAGRYAVYRRLTASDSPSAGMGEAGTTSRLGAPDTSSAPQRPALALGPASRPMSEHVEHLALPAAGETGRWLGPDVPHSYNLGHEQRALPRAGQTTNARSSLDRTPIPGERGPSITPVNVRRSPDLMTHQFNSRLQSRGTPDARESVGPSMGSTIPDNPSAPLKARRAPAGMDSRKRGTWANYS